MPMAVYADHLVAGFGLDHKDLLYIGEVEVGIERSAAPDQRGFRGHDPAA